MNLLQAIDQAGGNWIKPKGTDGHAYQISFGYLIYRDSQGYQECRLTPCLEYLTGEWEIVTPEQVMAERKNPS